MTIVDYWRVIWVAKWSILALTVVATLMAFGVARLQPRVYTARATVLTPKESGASPVAASMGALLGGMGGSREGGGGMGLSLPAIGLQMPSVTTSEDVFVALLKSRSMREEVLGEFSKTWGSSVDSMVISAVPNTRDKGVLALVVEATNPQLAADIANHYFQTLDGRLQRNAEQATRRKERFLASQLERAAKEVSAAEEALLKFQAENRMLVAVDPTTKAGTEGAATLRGTIMAFEMQREVMRMRYTDAHPQMRELEKQITELKKQYSQNLFGAAMDLPPESPGLKRSRKEFFVSAEKMTPIQFSFLRLFRSLKIQEAFYIAAIQGLEQIRYENGMSPVSVEVLDPAIPPSAPSRPRIGLIVGVAAVSSLSLGILLALVLEYAALVRAVTPQPAAPPARVRTPGDGAERHDGGGKEAAHSTSGPMLGRRPVKLRDS